MPKANRNRGVADGLTDWDQFLHTYPPSAGVVSPSATTAEKSRSGANRDATARRNSFHLRFEKLLLIHWQTAESVLRYAIILGVVMENPPIKRVLLQLWRTAQLTMSQADGPDSDSNIGENVEISSVRSAATTAPLVDLHACGICFQLYDESERLPKVLSCGHTNCLTCLNSWVKHSSSPFPVCSICRRVTRKPVKLLPNNFQLLQVLRRMKLTSSDAQGAISDEQQNTNPAEADGAALQLSAVCEQVDEHMHEVASLLENQMEALSVSEQQSVSGDQGLLFRMIENSIADLLSRWESTKGYLLDAEKRKNLRSSSRESLPLSAAFSEISAVIYDALHDDTSGILDFIPFRMSSLDDVRVPPSESSRFNGIYDWSGESDTLTHAYSDFSLFGSESHDTAVSASQSSSQDENFPAFIGWEESPIFPHISTFHGPFTTYSRCSLCQCRFSTSFASHQTHVRGRRHQQAIGGLTDSNPAGRRRRRLHTEHGHSDSHSSNQNVQNNRPSNTNAATSAPSARSHEPNAGSPYGRRSQTENASDQRQSSQQEATPRHARANRRNGRVPTTGDPTHQLGPHNNGTAQGNTQRGNQAARGTRNGNDSNRRNNARTTHPRRADASDPGARNTSRNGWQNQGWSTAGWGQPYGYPYEYVPEWSLGYGGYIQ
ncbi:hypothetical protein Y032_0024g881 [Ancylostoma ceylanicum]|uniref:RING-type domain-containing protein n=1 Tax=Ancylostoma ceylanicum TaxID=53326 RepID=A0A016UXH8_9BILA|nr:hypothetical protein Y032_0024g881 [Ancylostoma ceylanicum]